MTLEYMKQPQLPLELMPEQLYGDPNEWKNSQNLFEGQDMSKLVKTYLEEQIPDQFKETELYKHFWAVLGNTIKLTFLNEKDEEFLEIMFEQTKITYIMSKPARKFTFYESQMLEQLKIYFMAACKRAIGSPGHRLNERTIIATQINQVIRSNTESLAMGQSGGGGFFSRLRRAF